MRSAIAVLLLLGIGVAGAMWLAQLGGSVEIDVAGTRIATSFPIALLLLCVAFLVLHLLLALLGALRRWPRQARLRRQIERQKEGDQAVTRVLVALGAGTGEAARIEARKARQLLGDTPQTLLLAAEAEKLAGREDAAADVYRTLSAREDARFLGIRGLLRQAMQKEDWAAAQALAKEAEAVQPGAAWLREERGRLALETHDWKEALALAPPEVPKAAIALAAAAAETDPAKAAELERQAHAADRGFAPAALAHAKRLAATGHPKRARGVLEEAWAAQPAPDLAEPYLANETDPLKRVKAAEALVRRNPQAAESRLLMARVSLDAGLTGRARAMLDALVASNDADRRAYLMLAELEEAEHGESADARAAQARWLREAAEAPSEPRWRCGNCGAEQQAWVPVCPSCASVGRVARLAAVKRPGVAVAVQ